MKRLLSAFVCLVLILSCFLFNVSFNVNAGKNMNNKIAIVFTHDLHSHIDPFPLDGKSVGGFARIKSVIDNTKAEYPNTLVVDGGDFSMGTLFQTAFTTDAIEYRMLGQLGYDAITFGNHEFDYGFETVKDMISVANSTNENLPPILCANINATKSNLTLNTLSELNIRDYSIVTKGNFSIAVFGILGHDAVELSSASGLTFDDYIDTAKNTVTEIKKLHSPDLIVCLSHGGTGDTVKDEDIELAKEVPDIDVIISGHTHSFLRSPLRVNDTLIASCGEYGEYIGRIILSDNNGKIEFDSYELIPINDTIKPDSDTQMFIDSLKGNINEYLNRFGYTSADEIIAYSPFDFPEQQIMDDSLAEQQLGNLISDSYIHAIQKAEGDEYINVDVAIAPLGVIRASIDKGNITVSQAFEISSLGIGNDGVSGYPLCSVYLTGKELWALAEIDASVSSIMSYAQLYCSGLGYSVNTKRMFMNRVYDCWLIGENGERIEIEEDKLYRVVSGLTSAEMLSTVKGKSFGLLKLTPKDEYGREITDFDKHIVTDSNNQEVKEWKALADYLSSFSVNKEGISEIPLKYASLEGRKNISEEFILSQLFTNWNFITWAVVISGLFLIFILVLIVWKISNIIRKKRIARLAELTKID